MAASLTASAQYVTTGKVVDVAGNPVSGARVEAKGTKVFVTTGVDGRFTLETTKIVEKVKVRSAGHLPKKQEVSSNMTITLKNDNWWSRPATRYQFFISPQVTIPNFKGGDVPFGVMIGVVRNIGVYARYVQSKMPDTSMELDRNNAKTSEGYTVCRIPTLDRQRNGISSYYRWFDYPSWLSDLCDHRCRLCSP